MQSLRKASAIVSGLALSARRSLSQAGLLTADILKEVGQLTGPSSPSPVLRPCVCNSALTVWVLEDAALWRLGEAPEGGSVNAAMEKPSTMLGADFPVWQL